MKWLFLIWGLGGFILCFVALITFAQSGLVGLMGTGVGILFWIGGMIFFGFGHVMTER